MKVSAARSAAFVAALPAGVTALLLFGPDAGSVRDRASGVIAAIVDNPADPFRVAIVAPDALRAAPGALVDEVNALTFGGGRRVVNLRGAGDEVTSACQNALAEARGDTLLLVEAGDLSPRSKLRALFERAKSAAAVPCYASSARDLHALTGEILARNSLSATPAVEDVIARHIGVDHLVSRRELEKLALYCAGAGQVTVADADAVLADTAAQSTDDLVNAVANGDLAAVDRHLAQLWHDQVAGVALVRAVARHLQRIWQARAMIDQGASTDAAMAGLRPPVFWKYKDAFRGQLAKWPQPRLAAASQRLLETEQALKTTGMPEQPVAGRSLLSIAHLVAGTR